MNRIEFDNGAIVILKNLGGEKSSLILLEDGSVWKNEDGEPILRWKLRNYDIHLNEQDELCNLFCKPNIQLQQTIIPNDFDELTELQVQYVNNTCNFMNISLIPKDFWNTNLFRLIRILSPDSSFVAPAKNEYNEIVTFWTDATTRYNAALESLSKRTRALTNRMRAHRREIYTNASPIIVSPTLSAVLVNEANAASDAVRNQKIVASDLNEGVKLCIEKMQNCVNYQSLISTEIPKRIKHMLQRCRQRYIDEIITLEGDLANIPAWQAVKRDPFSAENYANLIASVPYSHGIDKLIELMGIDVDAVEKQCFARLNQTADIANFEEWQKKNDQLINNLLYLTGMSKKQIVKNTYLPMVNSASNKLITMYKALPSALREKAETTTNVDALVDTYMHDTLPVEGLRFLAFMIDPDMVSNLTKQLFPGKHLDADGIYSQVRDSLKKRAKRVRDIAAERDKALQQLEKRKEQEESELNGLGIFSFSKKKALRSKIEATKSEIHSLKQKYQDQIKEV